MRDRQKFATAASKKSCLHWCTDVFRHSFPPFRIQIYFGYRRRKWNYRPKLKFWTRFSFYVNALGKSLNKYLACVASGFWWRGWINSYIERDISLIMQEIKYGLKVEWCHGYDTKLQLRIRTSRPSVLSVQLDCRR